MTKRILLAITLAMACSAANAGLTPYSSEMAFLGALTGDTGTEDFESFTGIGGAVGGPDASGVVLTFTGVSTTGTISYTSGGMTAGVNPDAFISNWSSDYSAVSGTQFLNVDNVLPGSLTITFSEAVSAFGFNLIDAGDFGVTDNFQVTTSAGDTVTVATAGNASATVNYVGFVDTMGGSFTSVTFDQQALPDLFGLDDLTIQVFEEPDVVDPMDPTDPNAVPEPASVVVWLALLVTGVVYVRRRKDAA